MSDVVFAGGLFYKEPSEKSPNYVLGGISVKVDEFVDWLGAQDKDEQGFVRLSIMRAKSGKAYVKLDTWQPKAKAEDDPF